LPVFSKDIIPKIVQCLSRKKYEKN